MRREQIHGPFRARGLEPSNLFHSDENNTVHGLVAAAAGMGLIPKLAVDPNDTRVVAVELDPKVPPRVIALAWHRDRYRGHAAHAFVELAAEVCAALERPPHAGVVAAG